MDKCARCGDEDEDLRTLWHACFYKMEELGLPFEKSEVFNIEEKNLKRTKKKRIMTSQSWDPAIGKLGPKKLIPYNETIIKANGRVQPRDMYTLRVCKDCRADWMSYIKSWFSDRKANSTGCGSGIFVRRNGATIEISEEEWYSLNPGREPVRVR